MSTTRILFMGTPEFAVATLNALVTDGQEICAVVTAPDRPAGRGRQIRMSAVKMRALELGLPILQPERLRSDEFAQQLHALRPDLMVVVAFRMLPEQVWSRPALGTVNLHASLLPQYRGAAPINWAVVNGERQTGVTTFLIQQEIDTGDILLREEVSIGAEETAGELHDRMMVIGADLMVRTVHGLIAGSIRPVKQPSLAAAEIRTAPKISSETTRLDLKGNVGAVHDLIRGMSPFPGAWCMWHDGTNAPLHCKILRSHRAAPSELMPAGTVRIRDGALLVACANGWLEVQELQLEGRRRMKAAELVHGIRNASSIHIE